MYDHTKVFTNLCGRPSWTSSARTSATTMNERYENKGNKRSNQHHHHLNSNIISRQDGIGNNRFRRI